MDDRAEFQELALANFDSFYNYARVLTPSASEAEDLLQDTLLRAFRGFRSFKRELSFRVWMFRIMKNAQIDRSRRLRARPAEEPWQAGEEPSEDAAGEALLYPVPLNPEEILLRRVTIEEVREAMRRLPAALREVVELREMEGLSYQEIASVLGSPIGTVMSRLYRGRNLVRLMLQDRAAGEIKPRSAYGL